MRSMLYSSLIFDALPSQTSLSVVDSNVRHYYVARVPTAGGSRELLRVYTCGAATKDNRTH